ncbi:MAG: fibronectin type III domain-containing protein [Spirochaetaceae bacterium]|nr:fibronectin type III domain-containing protein [Spirochaetaceae bacterium]
MKFVLLVALSLALSIANPLLADNYSVSQNGMAWDNVTLHNLTFRTLADNSRRLSLSSPLSYSANLALTFEEDNEWQNFPYRLLANPAKRSNNLSRVGSFAAAFHGNNALVLEPLAGSLFTQQSGDFVIDFWFYPMRLAENEELFTYRADIILNGRTLEQQATAFISEGRLVWRFENLFLSVYGQPLTFEVAGSPLMVNSWRRHTLRYTDSLAMIELLDNGAVVNVAYANSAGRESAQRYELSWHRAANRRIAVGGFAGYLDNFVIYPHYVGNLNFSRFSGQGSLLTDIIDLDGMLLQGINIIGDTPNASQFRVFVRFDDFRVGFDDSLAWQQYNPAINYRLQSERYVQFRVDFFAGNAAASSPILHDFIVLREVIPPPPRPGAVSFTRQDNGVFITWQPLLVGDVAGYKIYFGTAPGDYFGEAAFDSSPIDVGNTTRFFLEGLTPGQLYYFTITAYSSGVNRQESAFAPERSFLP